MTADIITTSHSELKKKMLYASIGKHQTVIDDFQQGIKDLLNSASKVNEDEMDLSQQGINTEIIQQVDRLADQLSFANDEMKLLYDMISSIEYIHNTVQPGTVVVTDKKTFFVSASIEEFDLDGMKVFGLSKKSPLYKKMAGKKKGDSFTYKKTKYVIEDLF